MRNIDYSKLTEITVIREVPLEECGVYGKIIAKRLRGAEDANT